MRSSPSRLLLQLLQRLLSQRRRATPPPTTIPSSTAARVAERASSTRSFFSFSSTSVAAPTLTTATPPASLASLSWSFSRSNSEAVSSIWALICLIRAWIASSLPWPSMIVVSSLLDDDAAGAAEVGDLGALQLAAHVLGDEGAAGKDRDVFQYRLAPLAEGGGLDDEGVDSAAQLVHDQRGQRLAVAVVADDDEVLGHLERLLQDGQDLGDGGDLLVRDQDVGVVERRPPCAPCW